MSDNQPFPMEFRRALGSFATGVTIITTRAEDGSPLGLTVNSFNSVSLDPPLVLWSLANNSMSLQTFLDAPSWAVHVLSTDQADLSSRFARRGVDKFANLSLEEGIDSIPLLPGCSARFQCRTVSHYEGGDHVIFIGEVVDFDRNDTPPLVFHGGRYAHATRRDPAVVSRRSYQKTGFDEDFLGYLLGRAHFRFFDHIRELLEKEQLQDEDFYVLSTLTLKPLTGEEEFNVGMSGVIDESRSQALARLIDRGHVTVAPVTAEDPGIFYGLTEQGRNCATRLILAAKEVEKTVLDQLGPEEDRVLKSLLARLLAVIDPQADALWGPSQSTR